MFDSLRDQINGEASPNTESGFGPDAGVRTESASTPRPGRFMGMSALQRFVVAVLVFLSVCILGSMCLMITGAVRLP